MNIQPANNNVNFGYKSILKDLFKSGELPTVKYGLYGKKLNNQNCSLEHLIPKSKGGPNTLNNYALADKFENSRRGDRNIKDYLTTKMIADYLIQFVDVKVDYITGIFDGNRYAYDLIQTFKKLGYNL